jgi:adenylate cyclase
MATDLVVILSSDWVDSTATRMRLGEEPADTLQELHDSLLRKVIGAEGGEVIKHSGDGVLATFRSATSALAAAVNIQKEFARYTASPAAIAPVRVRVGLAAGDVKPMSGDIFGRPVVEAVRLQSLAAPDGILCSELVRVLTYGRGGFEFEDLGLRELKGLAPVQAHRVTRSAASTEGDRDALAQPDAALQRAVAPAEAGQRRSAPAEAAIAVLPFANMSSDPDQEYFSDGLSEELINQLAQIETLRVSGRTSSFALKNKPADFADIGAKLGVRYVLEGSVRKAGKRLRITAQLIDCSNGFHLWSERFDRDLDDVFAIQDEIAQAVARKLRVTFGVGPTRLPGGTQDADAYDLMLRARALIRRRHPGDAERAVELLKQALAIDPKFALGWNVLGNALTTVYSMGPKDPEAVRREIDEALGRSVALAPDMWTGHEAKANQLELRHDWVEAEKANARALALAPPSMREPVISRCNQLAIVGRIRDSIPFGVEAGRIEPLAPNPILPQLLFFCGRDAEAEVLAERCRELSTNYFLDDLFACGRAMARREHEKAKHYLAAFAPVYGGRNSIQREILEVFDKADRARALLHRCFETAADDGEGFSRLHGATLFAAYFGEPDLAVAIYRRIHSRLLGVYMTNFWHPLLRETRRVPAFKELAKEVGLVTYWHTTGQWGDFVRPLGNDDFEFV